MHRFRARHDATIEKQDHKMDSERPAHGFQANFMQNFSLLPKIRLTQDVPVPQFEYIYLVREFLFRILNALFRNL
ncbi:MAG: hypothetical protein CMM01_06215 [Rhodopirellula sp.]|nr:hypothetical protein [Rhodopirellula sp.]